MSKIQISSGPSSSATHRLTQASTTLNRRYVRRPSNIVVEEAARNATHENNEPEAPVAPSRLVNLRVKAADLEAARAKEEEARQMKQKLQEAKDTPIKTKSVVFTPNIVEFGADEPSSSTIEITKKTDATSAKIVKPEEPEKVEKVEISATKNEPKEAESNSIDTNELVMNIAADYAAASLGASIKEYGDGYNDYALNDSMSNPIKEEVVSASSLSENPTTDSVDAIARAASDAIASIRVATEPSEVSEQVSSLKAFADNIKSEESIPEMRELGDTIDKFINIAMKSTKMQEASKKSTAPKIALSPKASRAAAKVTKTSAKVMQANNRTKRMTANPVATNMAKAPVIRPVKSMHMPARRSPSLAISRDQALQEAMHSVATMESNPKTSAPKPMLKKRKSGTKRFAIAIACAAICVLGVIGIVGSNMPDISIRVAAMQTGIETTYPSYIPRDYSLSDINSENGKITMLFNGPDDATFTLIEEKSSWDSSALLRNFVEPTWQENYATTHEQGITIYISNANCDATWVNGGILYKITSEGTPLTKKQVRSIVTSL